MFPSSTASETLDREFLTCRARLIDLAAALDRIDRGEGSPEENPRWGQLRRALERLATGEGSRAKAIQMIFSLPYDSDWRREATV